ncbi:MAG: L-threonylcarbamoyladenylate synthase [Desulfovermiculus sp.]
MGMVFGHDIPKTAQKTLEQARQAITGGKVIIYPTETFYALGCNVFDRGAVERIVRIKGRPQNKPLPVIIGSMEQLQLVASEISNQAMDLARTFWPGPLSLILPARETLSSQAKDQAGLTSVRWSPHPVAQELCISSGVPLVGTSANLAGAEAVFRPEALDPRIMKEVDSVLTFPPYPQGGLPSSVVQVVGPQQLHVFRSGAVSEQHLQAAGWQCMKCSKN